MKIEDIEYHADGARLVGTLAVDDAVAGPRPGILVCHEGGGLGDHARNIAKRLQAWAMSPSPWTITAMASR